MLWVSNRVIGMEEGIYQGRTDHGMSQVLNMMLVTPESLLFSNFGDLPIDNRNKTRLDGRGADG